MENISILSVKQRKPFYTGLRQSALQYSLRPRTTRAVRPIPLTRLCRVGLCSLKSRTFYASLKTRATSIWVVKEERTLELPWPRQICRLLRELRSIRYLSEKVQCLIGLRSWQNALALTPQSKIQNPPGGQQF